MRNFIAQTNNSSPIEISQSFIDSIELELGCTYQSKNGSNYVTFQNCFPFGNFIVHSKTKPQDKFRVVVSFSGRTHVNGKINTFGRFFKDLFGDTFPILHFNSLEKVVYALQSLFDLWELYKIYSRTIKEYRQIVSMLYDGVDGNRKVLQPLRLNNGVVQMNTKYIDRLRFSAATMYNSKNIWTRYKNNWIRDMSLFYDCSYKF